MSTKNDFSKGDRFLETFEQQLALYRAKVYEKYVPVNGLALDKTEKCDESKSVILVIENNTEDWILMQWALRQAFPGSEIVRLTTTTQVNKYLENCSAGDQALPRMILLDLYLPSVSKGLRVLQSVKAHHLLQTVPVVTVSHSGDAKDIANAFKYASSLYLIKPPTHSEWMKRMGEIRELVRC